jgi:serine/threonine protein kinase
VSQRFVRCFHCGLPHALEETTCPITGRPAEGKRTMRPPEAAPAQVAPSSPPARPPTARLEESDDSHATSLLGQVLGGKYRALRVLGEGGMGTVFECEHVSLHRRVAVKVLHPAHAKRKASLARFHHEAHVAGAIAHANICEIFDVGELPTGAPFLVMELLQGETLAERITSEGALPFDDVVEIVAQVLSGLIAAHQRGIIHRDIKPENVFLVHRSGSKRMVKLLDFGISKVAGGTDELRLTRTGMVMGTPFYMSQEQARGDRNLDPRVDLYATGVVMYEALTGKRPFNAANYNALLVQILTTNPRPPTELRPAIPPSLEALCLHAMNRSREKRFQTAAVMLHELMALRERARSRPEGAGRPQTAPPLSRPNEPLPGGTELDSVSVDLDGRDLLDSDVRSAKSDSIDIPIVAEPPAQKPRPAAPLPPRPRTRTSTPPPPQTMKRGPTPAPPRLLTPTPTNFDDAEPTVDDSLADAPIDMSATERIPPERMAKLHGRSKKPKEPITHDGPTQPGVDDDAPTTLWNRKEIRKRMAAEPPVDVPPKAPRRK